MSIAEKLTAIAENEQRVYDAGKKAEYDAFWDACQINGNRVNYEEAFGQATWSKDNFKPKYNMQPTMATKMFYRFNNEGYSESMDLVARLEECGVTLDFSQSSSFNYCFQNARITHIGVMDIRKATTINGLFNNGYWLNTVDKLIVAETVSLDQYCFFNAAIKNIVIEGVLGCNVNFQSCPLSKESITSVINALSSTATGKTATFKKTAKEAEFTADEWAELIATKTNWTISLV